MTTADQIRTRLISLKLEATRLRAQLRKLEPKPKRAKVRKVKSNEELLREAAWDMMKANATHCEACGLPRGKAPSWWRAANPLDAAHVVSQPRIEDPRTCVILCRSCHASQHGTRAAGSHLPPLTRGNLHWLKMQHADYDEAFLRRYNGNKPLPEPEPLPEEYGR